MIVRKGGHVMSGRYGMVIISLCSLTLLMSAAVARPARADCLPIEFGAEVAAALDSAGEVDCHTFTAAAGDRIRLRAFATSGSFSGFTKEIIRPNGTTLCSESTFSA